MKFLYLIAVLLFIGCGTTQTVATDNSAEMEKTEEPQETSKDAKVESFNVKIKITHYMPYCGGTAPTEEMIKMQNSPQSNTNFILIDHSTDERTTVQTDSQGVLYLKLPAGNYALRETYKDCSFDEFYEKNYRQPDEWHRESSDPNCYRNWWAGNLGEFKITDADSLYEYNYRTSEACFVGRNPCVDYMGGGRREKKGNMLNLSYLQSW